MQPVKSSNISHAGYSGTTLTIQFKSGAKWSYHDVPAHIHRDLMASDSVGRLLRIVHQEQVQGDEA